VVDPGGEGGNCPSLGPRRKGEKEKNESREGKIGENEKGGGDEEVRKNDRGSKDKTK